MMETFVIAGRIIAGPFLNLCQKKLAHSGNDPFLIVWNTHLLMTLLAIPLLFCGGGLSAPKAFWMAIALAALLDFAGNALTIYSLKLTALSIFGPINAYKPFFALLFGVLILGERPGTWGLVGILLILGGTWLLNEPQNDDDEKLTPRGRFASFYSSKGVWLRFAAQLIFALGAIYLKKAVIDGGVLLSFAGWVLLPLPLAALCCTLSKNKPQGLLRKTSSSIASTPLQWVTLSALNSAMQLLTLFAFAFLFVGYALALFQLSALLHVYLGHRFLGEKNLRARLAGASIMGAGAALILLA